jgi:DNA-binding beta-propeller fold protein YncE
MKRTIPLVLSSVAAAFAIGWASPAFADSGGVTRFATLPAGGPGFPEGIAADADGNVYAATFDFSKPNVIYVFEGSSGRLSATIPVAGVPLGLAFDSGGDLFVADFGRGKVLRFAAPFGPASTPVAAYDVCAGAGGGCGLNGIAFDQAGDVYVSDSFGGNVFKVTLPGGAVSTYVSDARLQPGGGFPPFGANGLAFDAAFANLYIAHTANDRVFRYDRQSGALSTFASGIDGADGVAFDSKGRLWVAANQGDQVVALDSSGHVVARRGSFDGVGNDGAAKGLLFPASLAISHGFMYVTNLALALTPASGDEPEEQVSTYTVSRFKVDE